MSITVRVDGIDKLSRNLNEIKGPLSDGIKKLAHYVEGEARREAKPHSGDTGELARSIKTSIAPVGNPLSAKVSTDKSYAPYAEEGRRPGRMPPVDAIADWLRRHGGDETRAFQVARSIGRRGTKGIFFMKKAFEAGEKKANSIMREVEADIKRRWP